MAYNELIKNFAGTRSYMRQFFVYGFRSRDEFDAKSARSYDNEKRRVESWLSDYMLFRQDSSGKAVFLSVDSRHISHNPLYKAWKASSFTKNDVSLHFLLLDILGDDLALGIPDILHRIDSTYLPAFSHAEPIDESTLRKKLKEYVALGLLAAEKRGRQLVYHLSESDVNLAKWHDAVAFFSEDNPLGVIGSFLLDKYEAAPPYFSFKHRYLLFALDSDILLELLTAIREDRAVRLEHQRGRNGSARFSTVIPLKIYASVQGGRQYLAAYDPGKENLFFFRLDMIQGVKPLEAAENAAVYQERLLNERNKIWGVSMGQRTLERLEMTLEIPPEDIHIARRLEREKRGGTVRQLSETTWKFTAAVYDAWELLPWFRTFIGRIATLTCSNPVVERQFWRDLAALAALYGGGDDAV